MNAVASLQRRGLKRQEALLGSPVLEWKTQLLPCVPSYAGVGMVIDVGGNPVVIDFAAVVRRELFPTFDSDISWDDATVTFDDGTPLPRTGDVLRFQGRDYKVLPTVDLSPDGSHVIFIFGDPESGQ